MNKLDKIMELSFFVDEYWSKRDSSENYNDIYFKIPKNHYRYRFINQYVYKIDNNDKLDFEKTDLVLIDRKLSYFIETNHENVFYLEADEKNLKSEYYLDDFVRSLHANSYNRVIAVGGGLLLNVSGFIAENLNVDLHYYPSTILAMSDASIGGKVRVNKVDEDNNLYVKHNYKSFYEPSKIFINSILLNSFPSELIKYNLAEIFKHALYQSDILLEYLLSDSFDPYSDINSLLKAIFWTADLKKICLEIDINETEKGSKNILRAAHDISDRIEEESNFQVPHDLAVIKAMEIDLKNTSMHNSLLKLYSKFNIDLLNESTSKEQVFNYENIY